METAVIREVTSAMMDEAAHRAVEVVATTADHQAAVHPAPFVAENQDEPVPHPTVETMIVEAMIVEPVQSEAHAAAAEPEPSGAPDFGSSPIGIAAPAIAPLHDASETVPQMALPSLEVIEPMTAGEAAALVVAVSGPAGKALTAFQGDMTPPPGLPTPATEAFERTGETLRRNLPPPGDAIGLLNAQVMEMLASNMAATGQFLSALMGASTMTEVVAVNTHHLRRQMELLTAQGRQLATLARTITLDAMQPFGPSSTDHVRDR